MIYFDYNFLPPKIFKPRDPVGRPFEDPKIWLEGPTWPTVSSISLRRVYP